MIVSASIVYAYLYWNSLKDSYLDWDEVHYVQAAKQGFWANYLEQSSANIIDFVRLGLAKALKDEQSVKNLQQKLPDEKADLFRLRHFHPPFPIYVLVAFAENPRWSSLFLFGGFLVVFLYAFSVFYPQKWELALFFIPILCTSSLLLDSFFALNFHTYFALASLFFMARLYLYLQENTRKNIIFLAFSIALLALSLETYIALLVFTYLGLYLLKADKISHFLKLCGITLGFIFLLNPSFFWTGGSLKSWAMYIFRIFLAENEEYRSVNSLQLWMEIFKANRLLFTLLFFSLPLFFLKRKILPSLFFLPLFVAFAYSAFMSPFMLYQTYQIPAVALLIFSGALVIAFSQPYSCDIYIIALIISLLAYCFYANPFQKIAQNSIERNQKFDAIVAEIKNCQDKTILADGGHIFEFYTSQSNFQYLRTVRESKPLFFRRENYQNIDCTEGIENQQYGLIILLKSRLYTKEDDAFLEKNNYQKIAIGDYYLFKLLSK